MCEESYKELNKESNKELIEVLKTVTIQQIGMMKISFMKY